MSESESLSVDEKYKELEDIRSHLTNTMAETMGIYGVIPSVGRLYGTMYFHDDPTTLDDLHEELGMSKGSISNGVRKLIQYKYARRVFKRGERKDLYQAETDLYKNFVSLFTRSWERELQLNLVAIREVKPKYEQLIEDPSVSELVKVAARSDLEKVNDSIGYFNFLGELIKKTESGELFNLLNIDRDK